MQLGGLVISDTIFLLIDSHVC